MTKLYDSQQYNETNNHIISLIMEPFTSVATSRIQIAILAGNLAVIQIWLH